MPCVVCGEPKTIECHLLPRALYREIAGDQQHGFEASRYRPGVKYQAKGAFDRNLLCDTHEAMLGPADQYGIDFIKRFEASGRTSANDCLWLVPNPKPDLLVRFMAACVWRRGMSRIGEVDDDLALTNWEPQLRSFLFGNAGSYEPKLMLVRRVLTSQDIVLRQLMFEPRRGGDWGDDAWTFYAFGCEFVMKLNPYSYNSFPSVAVANNKHTVWAVNLDPQEFTEQEGVMDIAVNMFIDPKTGKARKPSSKAKPG